MLVNYLEVNATNIDDLDKVRQNHFEFNDTIDINLLNKCVLSPDKALARYAKGLLGVYYIENLNKKGDQIWIDLSLESDEKNQSFWFKNEKSFNQEMLLFDDLFRICMVYKKYYFFHQILGFLYESKISVVHLTYSLFIKLRTGNMFNFFDTDMAFKKEVSNNLIKQLNEFNSKLRDRILYNITAIGLSNYDNTNINAFINDLSIHQSNDLNDSSSFEKILFNLSLLNFKNDSINANKIALLNNEKIVYTKYCSPFITQYELENMPLLQTVKDVILEAIHLHYNYVIDNTLRLDNHLNDLLNFKLDYLTKKNEESINIISKDRFANLENNNDLEFTSTILNKIDSINIECRVIPEPAWLYEKFMIIHQAGSPDYNVKNTLNKKYLQPKLDINLIPITYDNDYYKSIISFNCIDNVNIYSLNFLLNYLNTKSESEIINDTSLNKKLDSLYIFLNYIKEHDYIFSSPNTIIKYVVEIQCQKFITVLEHILYLKKDYEAYESICKIDDSYYSLTSNKSFPPELYVISNQERYLAFKCSANELTMKKFDSSFTTFYMKEIAIKDSIIPVFKKTLFTPIIRDIIFDVQSRNNISDSMCIGMIASNDLLINLSIELDVFNYLYSKYSDSNYLINAYKNNIFCIDNSKLDTKLFINNNDINLESFKFLFNSNTDTIINEFDTTSQNLIYILAEDLNKKNLINFTYEDLLTKSNLTLYGIYSSKEKYLCKRIIQLDSLKEIYDYNKTKDRDYYSKNIFNEIDLQSENLYNILLKPFENYINSKKELGLILPASLNAIPLDYLYSKKQGYFPNFIEYSSILRAAKKHKLLTYLKQDTAAIFSEMIYNNIFCNINKSINTETRSTILPLKYSLAEKNKIKNNIKSIEFTGNNASKENFIKTVISRRYPIIHLITHGSYIPINSTYNTNILNDSILTTNWSKIKNNEERQLLLFSSDSTSEIKNSNNLMTAYETRYFEDLSKIKLIFLSACETGSIDVNKYYNSGYQGFANNFLERGVKSVIATRWKVNDSYSVEFADKYYQNLNLYMNYQKAFYETKKYFFQNKVQPYLWSSYVFIQ